LIELAIERGMGVALDSDDVDEGLTTVAAGDEHSRRGGPARHGRESARPGLGSLRRPALDTR